jgi:hypothetical protein
MMKIDVQGCEIDVLKGAEYTLSKCTDLLIELQHTEYNQGAPLKDEAIEFLKSIGFKQKYALPATPFDGDYHFVRE